MKSDEFALVAPGQADPPTQVTILFDASGSQIDAFRPTGGTTSIGTRSTASKTAVAVVVLALETIGLLFVGLVAAAGFAVMAQRRLRALGITSLKRSPLLPDLPAISETVPGFESVTWFGVYGPKGLPPELVQRLNTALNQALQDPEVKDRLARLGIDPVGGTPQQFAAMLEKDRAKWRKIISERRISPE